MPADREIHFGYSNASKVWAWANKINLPIVDPDNDNLPVSLDEWLKSDDQIYVDINSERFNNALDAAFLDTISAFGWQVDPNFKNTKGYVGVITPWGFRQAGIWSLCLHHDSEEIGDESENLTYGVNLSSRYYPSILDMKDPHGTLGSTITLDKDFMTKIEICRSTLIAHIPELADGEVFIREIFY